MEGIKVTWEKLDENIKNLRGDAGFQANAGMAAPADEILIHVLGCERESDIELKVARYIVAIDHCLHKREAELLLATSGLLIGYENIDLDNPSTMSQRRNKYAREELRAGLTGYEVVIDEYEFEKAERRVDHVERNAIKKLAMQLVKMTDDMKVEVFKSIDGDLPLRSPGFPGKHIAAKTFLRSNNTLLPKQSEKLQAPEVDDLELHNPDEELNEQPEQMPTIDTPIPERKFQREYPWLQARLKGVTFASVLVAICIMLIVVAVVVLSSRTVNDPSAMGDVSASITTTYPVPPPQDLYPEPPAPQRGPVLTVPEEGTANYAVVLTRNDVVGLNDDPGPGDPLFWGPNRQTFRIFDPARHIAFNSIVDNPVFGDERRFVGIRERSSIERNSEWATEPNYWVSEIEAHPGREYIVRFLISNNEEQDFSALINPADVRISVAIPNNTSQSLHIQGYLEAAGGDPELIWSGVRLFSDRDFSISFVPGSARLFYGYWAGRNSSVSDDTITRMGNLLRFDSLFEHAHLRSGAQYANYLVFIIRTDFIEE